MPVNPEYHLEYAEEVMKLLKENGIRVETDARNEKLGYRLREAQTAKVPYTLILGDQEKEEKTISYRLFGQKDTTTVSQEEFLKLLQEEISKKQRS